MSETTVTPSMYSAFENESEFLVYFKKLYLAYSGKIYNYVLTLSGGNAYLAEEIVQITFMKLWERRLALKDRSLVISYMYTIVRNTFFNMCEREMVRHIYYNYILRQADIPAPSIEEQIDARAFEELVALLVDRMPQKRREVFVKRWMEHKSNKEIAEEMNISENTVETHITLALRYLRENAIKMTDHE